MTVSIRTRWLVVLIVVVIAGFATLAPRIVKAGHSEAGTPDPTSPRGVVDSAIPREEALRRFRENLLPVDSLTDGVSSRDGLVRAFVRAVETSDTAALGKLLMSRREFAWVYYPTTPQGLPPYDLSPDLLWFMLENGTSRGVAALLSERAGRVLDYVGFQCDSVESREGLNTVVGPCSILRRQASDTLAERLFGLMINRGKRWKFVSYANQLD